MASLHQTPLDVVWHRQDIAQVLESGFLHALLARATGRPLRLRFVENETVLRDDLLVVVLGNPKTDLLGTLRRHGHHNIGLVHMGDERADHDLGFYAQADYVLRNYHFPHILRRSGAPGAPPVVWVPNGPRDGIGPRPGGGLLPASERTTLSFFSGMIFGESAPARRRMIEVIQSRGLPCALFATRSFGGGFTPAEYAGRLEDSVFGLVPMGNSVETIRLYDCLELGTIPVMLKADFVTADDGLAAGLGLVPFPTLERWEDLEDLFRPFLDRTDPAVRARLDAWQREVATWWSLVKERKALEVGRLVMGR